MTATCSLSLPEWTVLAVLDERPAHGFAVAALTAGESSLGRVWQIPRPVVYRAIGRLEEAALIETTGLQPGRGPRRQMYDVTPAGHSNLTRWLREPVPHVREVRSQLLMKLALLDRRGEDPTDLLERQRSQLHPIVASLAHREGQEGFGATLDAWRRASASATMDFLDELLTEQLAVRTVRRARERT